MSDLVVIPEYALFCDLSRKEDTGKRLFIGVYTQGLAVESFPQNISFSIYLHGRFEGAGARSLEVLVSTLNSEVTIFHAQAEADPDFENMPGLKFELDVPPLTCHVEGNETVIVQIRSGDNEWKEFGRMEVTLLDRRFIL